MQLATGNIYQALNTDFVVKTILYTWEEKLSHFGS